MNFLLISFVLIFLTSVNGQIAVNWACENPDTAKNFDVAKYTGLWYETYRYENRDQLNSNCNSAEYTLVNGTVNVFNTMVVDAIKYNISGTAIADPNANGNGKLLVNFPSVDANYSQYWVLDTDYLNYSLVYSCTNVGNNSSRVSSWILSRTEELKPASVLALAPTIEKVAALIWDEYRRTSQNETICKVSSSLYGFPRY